jgi:hypothetical protein
MSNSKLAAIALEKWICPTDAKGISTVSATTRTRCARLIVVLLCATLLNAGCFSTYRFDPDELQHLDGYQVRNEHEVPVVEVNVDAQGMAHTNESSRLVTEKPYRMISRSGEPFSYTSEKELYFIAESGFGPGGRLEFVEVGDEAVNARTLEGEEIDMSIDSIAYLEGRTPRPQRTNLAIGAGVLTLVMLVTFAAGQ